MNEGLGGRSTRAHHHFFSGSYGQTFKFDIVLITLTLLLIGFGLVVLYSAVGQSWSMFLNQAIRLCLGLGCLILASQLRVSTYYRWAPTIYAVTIMLLFAVAVFGVSSKGSQRWLDLPGLPRFQPSEFLKISLPLIVGWYITTRNFKFKSFDYWALILIIGLPTSLVFLQPDYGTALILLLGVAAMLFLCGIRLRWFAAGLVLVAVSAPIIWNFVFREYHRQRIITLFNPERDPLGAGWNIIQSKTAVGSGGLTGKGLFEGTQSHLDFLPEGHTDFIIAVIGEELGFVWCTALLFCYLLIFSRLMYWSTTATNGFGYVVGTGITVIFFGYVLVNVAMVLGLLPVVGLPLPLVSYGGSSAITTMAAFGVALAVCAQKQDLEK